MFSSAGHDLGRTSPPKIVASQKSKRPSVGDQRIDKLIGVERFEVVDLFAHADVFDRNSHLLADGYHHSALRTAVEFGQNDAGALGRVGKVAGLADAVLSRGCIEHEQAFVGSARNLLADHAVHLGEFVHQVLLGLQSARSIDDEKVAVGFQCPFTANVCHAGRIGTAGLLNDFAAKSFAS